MTLWLPIWYVLWWKYSSSCLTRHEYRYTIETTSQLICHVTGFIAVKATTNYSLGKLNHKWARVDSSLIILIGGLREHLEPNLCLFRAVMMCATREDLAVVEFCSTFVLNSNSLGLGYDTSVNVNQNIANKLITVCG